MAPGSVSFHGAVSRAYIHNALCRTEGLLFPSLWLEPAPAMSYVEAVAAGTPVVAWPGTAVADDVRVSGSGVVVTGSVEMALADVRAVAPQLSVAARQRYERQFTERAWVAAMDSVYRSVTYDRDQTSNDPPGVRPHLPCATFLQDAGTRTASRNQPHDRRRITARTPSGPRRCCRQRSRPGPQPEGVV